MKAPRLFALVGVALVAAFWLSKQVRVTQPGNSGARATEVAHPTPAPAGSGPASTPGASHPTSAASGPAILSNVQPAGAAENGGRTPPAWVLRMLSETNELEKIPREQLDRWLRLNGTNAASLLAARQAGGGSDYLRQALERFPNDPQVLFAALTLRDSPEEKQDRLERFKAAAPDNALPDYLSARNHFKNGQPEEAIRDLVAAVQKTQFQDYVVDAMQSTEELYLSAGKSPGEAKTLGVSSALLPHLTELKALAGDMAALQRDYIAAGDAASAENLARYGLALSKQLGSGEASRTLISQLVGMAIERKVLEPLDPSKAYDFIGVTPQERIEQIRQERSTISQSSSIFGQRIPTMNEGEIITYFERLKLYGERNALEWLNSRPIDDGP